MGCPTYAAEYTRIDLVQFERSADATTNSWFFRLPEHIAPAPGSRLKLEIPTATEAPRVAVNGQVLADIPKNFQETVRASPVSFDVALPEHLLVPGWNRVTLWLQDYERTEGHIDLAFERLPLFPELRRFPESLTEEQLLGARMSARASQPVVSLLLAPDVANVHARGCAIVAARFGQVDYLQSKDCKIATLDEWPLESGTRNGVLIGTRSELSRIAMPSNVVARLRLARPREGLLAEIITPAATRWVIASGADDEGLEKALLCLGSAQVLNELAPTPVIIGAAPDDEESSGSGSVASKPAGLEQLRDILAPGPSLRKTAFLLAETPSMEDITVLFDIAMHLGRSQPKGALQPEACVSGSEGTRLADRRVLFLGPIAHWTQVARETRLAVRQFDSNMVEIQGRKHSVYSFEPSLAVLQLLASPWNSNEFALIAGGWRSSAGPALMQLFTNAAPAGKLFGNICAADAHGRVVAYDTRRPANQSFAARLRKHIPRGATAAETAERLAQRENSAARSTRLNRVVFYSGASLMVLLIAARLLLAWENTRQGSRPQPAE